MPNAPVIPVSHAFNAGDRLRLRATSIAAGACTVLLRAEVLTDTGELVPILHTLTVNANSSASSGVIPLLNGYLVRASIRVSQDTILRGMLHVRLIVQHGDVDDDEATEVITAGYITARTPLIYPTSNTEDVAITDAALQLRTGTAPAAGNEFSFNTPTLMRSRVKGGQITFVTSAAAANRTATFVFSAMGIQIFEVVSPTVQTASQTRFYRFWIGPDRPASAGTQILMQLPNNIDASALAIDSSTANIDAGDQWGDQSVILETNINNLA